MQTFKTLFSFRVLIILFSYVIFTPSVYAVVASFTASPDSGSAPLAVALNGKTSSPSPGATIKSYQWQSSDGQHLLPQPTAAIVFSRSGSYTITLIVEDTFGATASMQKTITVNSNFNPTPIENQAVAMFTASPRSGSAPLTVTLDASESGSDIVSYQWQSSGGQNISSTEKPTVTFNQPGNYIIILTVRNSSGSTDTIQTTIAVSPSDGNLTQPDSPFLVEDQGASFHGGVLSNGQFLSNGSSFSANTLISVKGTLTVAPVHVGQRADILVAVEYFPLGATQGEWYFKTESTAFPFLAWDFDSPFIPTESAVILGNTRDIEVFTGHFENLPGKYDAYFGYRLLDSDAMVSNLAMPISFHVNP